jgi:hypothetical protein
VSNLLALFGTSTTSPSYIGTSVLGFRIDNIMSPQVYFSVQCTTSFAVDQLLIAFDQVLVNAGNAWNKKDCTFTAPYSGNYFFSFAAAVQSATAKDNKGGIALFVNSQNVLQCSVSERQEASTFHNSVAIARCALMLPLAINDVALFKSYNEAYSTTDGLINAQGFYYSPLGNAAAVAWSVTTEAKAFSGPLAVLQFERVQINMRNVWNNVKSKVTVPVAGMCLVDLTIHLYMALSLLVMEMKVS